MLMRALMRNPKTPVSGDKDRGDIIIILVVFLRYSYKSSRLGGISSHA